MSASVNFQLKLMDWIKRSADRIGEERELRRKLGAQCLTYGVQFLDENLGGIYSNDLCLYIAKSGLGKTHLATLTAMANARAGKRVHFFALEAEPNEIERRIKYQMLAEAFFKSGIRKEFPGIHLSYLDWYYGKLEQLERMETEIESVFKELYPSLWTYYRSAGDFTVQDFEKKFLAIQDQTDLIICDHVHYFDSDDENENRALKTTVKKIRDLALLAGKPVVLVAHVRKSERRIKQVVPSLDDVHGSSDITKIATKVIALAPCPQAAGQGNRWPTYIRAAKCRVDGSRTKFVGLVGFNADTNAYERDYFLGRLSPGEDEFEGIRSFNEMPYWAKAAKVMPND